MENKEKQPKPKRKRLSPTPINDSMNTLMPDKTGTPEPPANEAELFKQAENPLGDPNKI